MEESRAIRERGCEMESKEINKEIEISDNSQRLNTFYYHEAQIFMGWPRPHSTSLEKYMINQDTGQMVILSDDGWKLTEYGEKMFSNDIKAKWCVIIMGIIFLSSFAYWMTSN